MFNHRQNIQVQIYQQVSSEMRLLWQASRFGMKNFYKQLGLSQHFTIRGAMHRFQRQYPRVFKIGQFALLFSVVTSTSAVLLPGTSLPFQYTCKQFILQRALSFSQFWYLSFGNPDALGYVYVVYDLLTYLVDNGLENEDNVASFIKQANRVMVDDSKGLYKVKDVVRIENISNCVLLMSKIIDKFKISHNASILTNPKLLQQLSIVADYSVLGFKGEVSEIDKKLFISSFKIFEFLLKFSKKQKHPQILQKIITLLSDPTKKFMSYAFIQQQGLKNQLKLIYQMQPENKHLILQILQIVQKSGVGQ